MTAEIADLLKQSKELVALFQKGQLGTAKVVGKPLDGYVKGNQLDIVKAIFQRLRSHSCRVAVANETTSKGTTPLFTACAYGNLTMAKLLVENGAKVHWRNSRNHSALTVAAMNNNTEIVEYLLHEGADALSRKEVTELNKKISNEIAPDLRELMAQYYSNPPAAATLSPLHRAAYFGDFKSITELLGTRAAAARLNDLDGDGQTVLFTAAARGHLEICKFLIELGIKVNVRDRDHR